MLLRPYGVIVDGQLELGLEVLVEDGRVIEMRPHTGIPDPYILSPAFVNAHSHLEYRGLLGAIEEPEYWGWIRKITELKKAQDPEQVRQDCFLAAEENRRAGVWYVEEHSDRPYAAEAMKAVGLRGHVYQEVITFFEQLSPAEKVAKTRSDAAAQGAVDSSISVSLGAHSAYTVDKATLQALAATGEPLSIHVAETEHENAFFERGEGPIAEFYRRNGFAVEPTGVSVVKTLEQWGVCKPWVQFVHCCAVSEEDIEIIARNGVRVAHCPRSNVRLKCPIAPVREMLDAGIQVGLGLDSAASSGPIDMFAEMRSALEVSLQRGRPVTAEEVWKIATPAPHSAWIHIPIAGALDTYDVVERFTERPQWLSS